MVFDGRQNPADWNTYSRLIHIHTGDDYNGQRIKASLENLFKTDDFPTSKRKSEQVTEETIDLYFVLREKSGSTRSHSSRTAMMKLKARNSGDGISLRKGDIFEEYNLEKAVSELQTFLKSRGFFAAGVKTRIDPATGKGNRRCVPDRVRQTGHDPQSDIETNDPAIKKSSPAIFEANRGTFRFVSKKKAERLHPRSKRTAIFSPKSKPKKNSSTPHPRSPT